MKRRRPGEAAVSPGLQRVCELFTGDKLQYKGAILSLLRTVTSTDDAATVASEDGAAPAPAPGLVSAQVLAQRLAALCTRSKSPFNDVERVAMFYGLVLLTAMHNSQVTLPPSPPWPAFQCSIPPASLPR